MDTGESIPVPIPGLSVWAQEEVSNSFLPWGLVMGGHMSQWDKPAHGGHSLASSRLLPQAVSSSRLDQAAGTLEGKGPN